MLIKFSKAIFLKSAINRTQRKGVRAKTSGHVMGIMCSSGATCLPTGCCIVSGS